ncbi:sister chromatid cohesion protein PDS5 [Legionella gresilensis]|uniref:sister chromatid cohesion protein PDS5 n=1 Tax=Legionella gresilensis TaxID=91823 RepID=UPI00104161F6|nr:sister chromatid cohesion protein PDS5 [Legionella gresilensis]
MPSLTFFTALPLDVALTIHSKLSAETLYKKCRLVDKYQSFIATLALLNKQEIDAVPYQQHCLDNLLKKEMTFATDMAYLTDAHYKQLTNVLFKLIKNPLLDFKSKLPILLIISKLENKPALIDISLIHDIEAQLKSADSEEICLALNWLAHLAPCLLPIHLDKFITSVSVMLKEPSKHARQAIKCLSSLAPYAQTIKLTTICTEIMPKLADLNCSIRKIAVKCLAALAPYVTSTELMKICTNVRVQLSYDESWDVRQAAIKCLAVLAPFVKPTELSKICNEARAQLAHEDELIREAALNCLAVFLPHAQPREISNILFEVKAKLSDTDWEVREAAINCLAALVPLAQPSEIDTILTEVKAKLPDAKWGVRQAAVKCLTAFAPYVKPPEFTSICIKARAKLADVDVHIRLAAVNSLTWLASYGQPTELSAIGVEVMTKLTDADPGIRRAALKCLAAFAQHLQSTELNKICTEIKSKLTDVDWHVCYAAFQCLIKLVAKLPYGAQKEFISANSGNLLRSEFRGPFYQLVNSLISQQRRKDKEVNEILQLVKNYDPILHIFATKYNDLLPNHMVTDNKEFHP